MIVGETGGIGSGSFVHFSGWLSYADDVPEIRAHQKKQSIGEGMIVGPRERRGFARASRTRGEGKWEHIYIYI